MTWQCFKTMSDMCAGASYDAISKPALAVWDILRNMTGIEQGLAPIHIDPGGSAVDAKPLKAHFTVKHITLGARGDSYYEYMLKQYLIGGKKDDKLLEMYTESMRGVRNLLLAETKPCARFLILTHVPIYTPRLA